MPFRVSDGVTELERPTRGQALKAAAGLSGLCVDMVRRYYHGRTARWQHPPDHHTIPIKGRGRGDNRRWVRIFALDESREDDRG